MNFAIGFVIYNSDKALLERLKMLNDESHDIFIFDNSHTLIYLLCIYPCLTLKNNNP